MLIDDLRAVKGIAWKLAFNVSITADEADTMFRLEAAAKEFDDLWPPLEEWPDWAHWCVIHANGLQYFYDEAEPFAANGANGWVSRGIRNEFHRELRLLVGLDWRLCKKPRPPA